MLSKYLYKAKIVLSVVLPYFVILSLIIGGVLAIRYTILAPKLDIVYTVSKKPTVIRIDDVDASDITDFAIFSPTSRSNLVVSRNSAIDNLKYCKVGKYKLEGQDLLKDLYEIRKNLEVVPRYDNNGDPVYTEHWYKVTQSDYCYASLYYNDKGVYVEIGDKN